MKRNYLIGALFAAIAVLCLVPHPKDAHANTFTPPYVQIDSAATVGVAQTTQIQTGVFSTASCDDLEILVDNSGGSATRTLNIDWIAFDKTTVLYRRALTFATTVRGAVSINRFASASTAGTNETVIGQMPGTNMQLTLTAGTGTVGSLVAYCR